MGITREQLQAQAIALGFHKLGIAAVAQADWAREQQQHLRRWLDQGYQADMAWMASDRRQRVEALLPGVRSVICLAVNYYSPEQRPEGEGYAHISRYGWGRDYHRLLHKRLKKLGLWLEAQVPGCRTRWYADTGPIQDKVWAQQAGLGWIAKNGNLITREYGSWVFLGEILTDLEFDPDPVHTAHCGSCRRCLDACPTGAIVEPHVVDANRCIAYHTIENRAEQLPQAIADHMQGWVAGCDLCQDCCPWNQRFATPTDEPGFAPYPWNIAPTLAELAALSDEEWERRFTGSALRRIKPAMLRRNARAALGCASAESG